MNHQKLIFCLVFGLALSPVPSSQAQVLETRDWEKWNAVSKPLYPGENWMQYQTPEDAGWSSEGLDSAKRIADSAGSATVMVIYDGAIVKQWGQIARRFKNHSIRKSLLSALYGIAVARGDIDLDETMGDIGIDDDAGLTDTEKPQRFRIF